MNNQAWQLWDPGPILKTIAGFEPLLASWESRTHPAQIRLQAYLAELAAELGPLPAAGLPLFLQMEIDVRDPGRLLRHYDLENYLTPVVMHLGPAHFCL